MSNAVTITITICLTILLIYLIDAVKTIFSLKYSVENTEPIIELKEIKEGRHDK